MRLNAVELAVQSRPLRPGHRAGLHLSAVGPAVLEANRFKRGCFVRTDCCRQ